jgi:hypothetical protein
MARLFAGSDPVLLDTYAAALLDLDLAAVPYIAMASGMGVGSTDLASATILALNRGEGLGTRCEQRAAERYGDRVRADSACSACMSAVVCALRTLDARGSLTPGPRLAVGQGFRGRSGDELGIGDCTRGFPRSVPGCPPTTADVLAAITGGGLTRETGVRLP